MPAITSVSYISPTTFHRVVFTVFALLVVASGLFIQPQTAAAVSLPRLQLNYKCGAVYGNFCLQATNIWLGASTNKNTYVQGETMTRTVVVSSDDAPQSGCITAKLGIDGINYQEFFTSGCLSRNSLPAGYEVTKTYKLPDTISVGTHTINFTGGTTDNKYSGDNSSATFNVVAAPVIQTYPTTSLSQSTATTQSGQAFTLAWSSSSVTSCSMCKTINGGSCTSVDCYNGSTNGSCSTAPTVAGTYQYKFWCGSSSGTVGPSKVDHQVVAAPSAPPSPTVNLYWSPSSVAYGGTSNIHWSTSNATYCEHSDPTLGINVGVSYSQSNSLWFNNEPGGWPYGNRTTNGETWTMRCWNGSTGPVTRQAVLSVTASAPTCSYAGPDGQTVTATSGIYNVRAYGVSPSVTSMYFPTWGDTGGQDDLIWYPGVNEGGGTWRGDINLGSHKSGNPEYGNFNVHVYMNAPGYTNVWCDTANFSRSLSGYTLTTVKSGTGTGTVTSSPAGISCGSTCSANYTSGTSVTLSATANADSTFTGWGGASSPTCVNATPGVTCTVTMNRNWGVGAAFARNGACAATHYSCSYGTSTNNVDGPSAWTWSCTAPYGGTTASCSEAKPTTGTLTVPASCIVAAGASTCTVSASWSTNNATGAYLWDRNVGSVLYTANNSTGSTVWVWGGPGGTNFDLKNGNGTILDSKNATGACATGSSWNPNSGKCVGNAPSGTISASPNPCIAALGASTCSTNLTWSTTNVSNPNVYSGYTGGTLSTAASGSNLPATTAILGTTFSVRNSTSVLNSVTVTGRCQSPYAYSGGVCIACGNGGCTGGPGGSPGSPNGGLTCINGMTPPSCTPPPPTATLFVNPSIIDNGQTSQLTWSSTNATSCTAFGGFSTGGATSNSTGVSTGALTTTQNYQMSCTGGGGTANSNIATVIVLQPDVTLSANPSRVHLGETTTISWSASQVNSCSISGPGLPPTSGLSGTRNIVIAEQSTYTITCQTNSSPITKTIIVNLIPSFQEF